MKDFENDIIHSIAVLRNGGIILYPTDTIWGIGCDATNTVAIRKIYLLKKREEKKSMIILLAREKDIEHYVSNPSKKIIDFLSTQKMPATAIFENAMNLPAELYNIDGSIAIRIVKDDFCQTLISRLKGPLVSTSANVSGEDHPKLFKDINDTIKNGVDYVVQHRQNEIKIHHPSPTVRLNISNEIERVR